MGSLSTLGTDGSRTARTSAAALTADRLGEAWPEVSARLRRMLASRRVDPSLSDDIVQEVAVRALDKRVPFTDPDDLYRWASTAARRLHIDHLRSDCRMTGDDALVAVADGTDVAHAAERRVALSHVWRALATMRPGEQDAILDSLEDKEARSSGALVRRHRARATLRKAVGGVIAWAALAQLRLRDLVQPVNATAAAAVLAPVLAIGSGPAQVTPRPPAPVVAVGSAVAVAPAAPAAPAGPVTRPATRAASRGAVRPPTGLANQADAKQPGEPLPTGLVSYRQDNDSDQKSVFCHRDLERGWEWCVPDLASPAPRPPEPEM